MKNVFISTGDSVKVTNQIILKRMETADASRINQKIAHRKIVVYRLGELGKKFIDLLESNNIPVYGAINKKGIRYKEIRSLDIEDSEKDKTVIVTLPNQYDEIRESLVRFGWQGFFT